MALSDPAITKWLSPRWPADLPSLHRNPIICYLRTEWIRNRYAEKFIESITGASSSSAERSDESATRKVLLICDLQRSPVTFYAGFYSRDFVRRCYAPSKLSEARLARYKLDGSSWGDIRTLHAAPLAPRPLYDSAIADATSPTNRSFTGVRAPRSTLYLALT